MKKKRKKSLTRMPSLSEMPEMAEDAPLPRKPAAKKKKLKRKKSLKRMPSLSEMPEMAEDAVLPRKPAAKKKTRRKKSLTQVPELTKDAILPKKTVGKMKKQPRKKSIQAQIRRASARTSPRQSPSKRSENDETIKVPIAAPLTDVKVALRKLGYLGSTKSAATDMIAKVVKPQCRFGPVAAGEKRPSHFKCAYVGTMRDSQNSDASMDTDAYVPFMNNASMTSSTK